MSIYKMLAIGNFIMVNRDIALKLGINAAVMIAELANEEQYYERRGELRDGWFFSTVENIERATGLKRSKQESGLKELKESGLVETKISGLPAKRYFHLNENALLKLIDTDCRKTTNKNNNTKSKFAENQRSVGRKSTISSPKINDKFAENQPEKKTNYIELNKDTGIKENIYSQVSPDASEQDDAEVIDGDVAEVVAYLNERCNKHYRPRSKSTQRFIAARLKDGATVEEMKAVIDRKAEEWLNDPKMCKYLRPETLFNETKFETYRQEEPPETPTALFDDIDLSQFEGKWRS